MNFTYFILGILFYFIFALWFHLIKNNNNMKIYFKSLIKSPIFSSEKLFFIISPDYFSADIIKNNINLICLKKNYKRKVMEKKKEYLVCWNHRNLIWSIVFFLISTFICSNLIFCYIYKTSISTYYVYFLFCGFFFMRVISRSFEIGYAFFRDITDTSKKNPFLKSNKRIILATKSYLEIIFNFASLNLLALFIYKKFHYKYYLFFVEKGPISPTTLGLTLQDIMTIFYKSFGITTFTNASINSIFGAIQIITTLILVLFALAGYLNNKGG
ncbi:hypothetical protein VSU16_03555 [Cetobacterium somerae]|uniref:hypothetical protein n=1 Tax=Cetobacterium somerae TaxID=188913 RepID=UPI002E7B5930|nr:hypothetical protein [Cetobacterium somerae]WVJ01818.1 hypothetical protein VSU16_03555 [Cetobacterium somerae]